jgi:hypothetical protein
MFRNINMYPHKAIDKFAGPSNRGGLPILWIDTREAAPSTKFHDALAIDESGIEHDRAERFGRGPSGSAGVRQGCPIADPPSGRNATGTFGASIMRSNKVWLDSPISEQDAFAPVLPSSYDVPITLIGNNQILARTSVTNLLAELPELETLAGGAHCPRASRPPRNSSAPRPGWPTSCTAWRCKSNRPPSSSPIRSSS